jgi:hypothetical protein
MVDKGEKTESRLTFILVTLARFQKHCMSEVDIHTRERPCLTRHVLVRKSWSGG